MEEKISIIVPCYNVQNYIERCIKSIYNSNDLDIEVVAVDDGSKDNTFNKLKELSNIYHNLKIIHKDNGGLSSARNEGLKYANGKYVFFLDSDDFLCNNWQSIVSKYLYRDDIDVIMFNYYNVFNNTCEINFKKGAINTGLFENKNSIIDSLLTNDINKTNWSAWGKLYKKEFLMKTNIFFDENNYGSEDMEFNFSIFRYARKVFVSDECLVCYETNNMGSISNNVSSRTLECLLKNIAMIYQIIFEERYGNATSKKIYSCLSIWYLYVLRRWYSLRNENKVIYKYKKYRKVMLKSNSFKLKVIGLLSYLLGMKLSIFIFRKR